MTSKLKVIEPALGYLKADLGDRIRDICNLIDLNKSNFVDLLESSEPTVRGILTGESPYGSDHIFNICFIFGMSLKELANNQLKLPSNFREQLIDYHSLISSSIYFHLKNIKPSIDYAVKRIIETDLLNTPQKAGDIAIAIKNQIGFEYDSSTLITPLQNYKNIIDWKESKDNKVHYRYQFKTPRQVDKTPVGFLPAYIKVCRILNKTTTFEELHYQIEILNKLSENNETGKSLIRSIKNLPFNKQNVDKYITPLLSKRLVDKFDNNSKNDSFYKITTEGLDAINVSSSYDKK